VIRIAVATLSSRAGTTVGALDWLWRAISAIEATSAAVPAASAMIAARNSPISLLSRSISNRPSDVGAGIALVRREEYMKTLPRIIMGLALAAPLSITSAVLADDKTSSSENKQDVTMDQLPKPVKTTVQREGKGKPPASMTKSTDANGAAAYEIKYLDGDKETTIGVAANGKVLVRHVHAIGTEPSQPTQPNQATQPNQINQDTQNNPPSPPKNDMQPNDTQPKDMKPNDKLNDTPQKP
jgi:hypothetical protein